MRVFRLSQPSTIDLRSRPNFKYHPPMPKKPKHNIPPDTIELWRTRLARPASLLRVTGMWDNPLKSRFGSIAVMEPGEAWPDFKGRPMLPLAQLNLRDAPYVPPNLADLAMIRVWIVADFWEHEYHQGEGWCVRASASLDAQRPTPEPDHASEITPMGYGWWRCEQDFPTHDDLPRDIPEDVSEHRYDLFPHTEYDSKIGGWPALVQSEICWGAGQEHPIRPEYAFQIGEELDANWMWGDAGTGYFGRGTGPHRDKWAFEWQCC